MSEKMIEQDHLRVKQRYYSMLGFKNSITGPKRARSRLRDRAGDWSSGGGLQPLRERRMAQLLERFTFDLPDALSSDPEEVADLFERMLLAAPVEAETHPDNLL